MEESDCWTYMEKFSVSDKELDELLADGWRHFGSFFFRDRMSWNNGRLSPIIPLRINLHKFVISKSQKKILRKNAGVKVVFRDAFIDVEKENLFHKHCVRFKNNIPNSIYDFLSTTPATVPGHTMECCLYDEDNQLYAVSFLDIGESSTSSVYAMFDPHYSDRSPGLHTLLEEINFSIQSKKKYLYTGYAFQENSHYDYKKKFSGTEFYDWKNTWANLEMKKLTNEENENNYRL